MKRLVCRSRSCKISTSASYNIIIISKYLLREKIYHLSYLTRTFIGELNRLVDISGKGGGPRPFFSQFHGFVGKLTNCFNWRPYAGKHGCAIKGPFTWNERESEKYQRTSKADQKKISNIKDNFRFRSLWMGLNYWANFFPREINLCHRFSKKAIKLFIWNHIPPYIQNWCYGRQIN